ncbi:MAG: chromosomal replication initiator protein DnaA [Clostridia bacterium]
MTKAKIVWENAQELLKQNMTTLSYENWMLSLRPAFMDGDTLVLSTFDDFSLSTLQQFYTNSVSDIVSRANGEKINIRYITEDDLEKHYKGETEESDQISGSSDLIKRYTFDSFVVGNSNRFAHAAAIAVAEHPAEAYNPLFIYGGVGLGKTHLMHAIGNTIMTQKPNAKIIYVTSEMFTNELILALREKKNSEFRTRYRSVDALMVDDIQFIAGKVSIQEEFFHTFNALYGAGKQIILTSDKPPREIPDIEARLNSRFEGGLIADIQPPDFETRVAILREKANTEHINVSDDVLYHIARCVRSNIRTLEGALTRIMAQSRFDKCAVTIDFADAALKDIVTDEEGKKLSSKYIIEVVADYFSIQGEEILGTRRDRRVTHPRQIAMYLCRQLTEASLNDIGIEFGRDHTTVLHACEKIAKLIATESDVSIAVNDITGRMQKD